MLAAGATADYGRFLVGDEFEELVAAKLGVSMELARALLERVREREGEGYELRAAAFAVGVREPLALALPQRLRESAVRPFVEAMLETPAAQRTFATDGPTIATACADLAPA